MQASLVIRFSPEPEATPFCRIARSEIAAHEVFRNDKLVAFLDRGPIRPGHVQIIPVDHYDYFDTLPKEIAQEIIVLGQRIARCQKTLFSVERVAFLFTGGDISHAHCHLVPMVEKTDITSQRYIKESNLTFQSLPRLRDAEQKAIAAQLTEELKEQGD